MTFGYFLIDVEFLLLPLLSRVRSSGGKLWLSIPKVVPPYEREMYFAVPCRAAEKVRGKEIARE